MFARTERLLLRPGWPEDAPALFAAVADQAIVRDLARAPWPYSLADAQAFLAAERKAGSTGFVILRRTDGAPQLIGTIGLDRRRGGEIELGYWIARSHWGLGYATEAARAVVAIARDGLRLGKLTAGPFLDNPSSGRVLEKLGFRPTGAVASRYSAGRSGAAPCRLFELDLATAAVPQDAGDPACRTAAIAA